MEMILFDLDGTLWDSSAQVAESWNLIFREYGATVAPDVTLPVLTADDLRSVMGKTMEEIARIIMPGMEPDKRSTLFKKCEQFEVEYIAASGGDLYPRVRDTLEKLKNEGYPLAVVSNCQIDYVKAFLKSMNMESYFCDYEEWGRTGKPKSENIRLVMERNHCDQGVYVGDTQKDKDAAFDAGIPFIWASYGFGEVDAFDGKLEQFSDLIEVLSQVHNL